MMTLHGLGFMFDVLNEMEHGICPTCKQRLGPREDRAYDFTCNEACHRAWIDALIARFGEEKVITLAATGKRYRVPTRVILETGITGETITHYPEAP